MRTKTLIRFSIALTAGLLAVVPVALASPGDHQVGTLTIAGITGGTSTGSGSGGMDVYSYGISAKRLVSSSGGGGGAGKATVSELSVLKHADQASPKLFLAVATGQHFTGAQLDLTGDSGQLPFLTYCFRDVQAASDRQYNDGSASQAAPSEALSLHFARVTIVYSAFGFFSKQGFDFRNNVTNTDACTPPASSNNGRANK
jgi:type VI secretion system secreted protein Hcp